jgi:hypothetical protein
MVMGCVIFEVRSKCLNIIRKSFVFKGLKANFPVTVGFDSDLLQIILVVLADK